MNTTGSAVLSLVVVGNDPERIAFAARKRLLSRVVQTKLGFHCTGCSGVADGFKTAEGLDAATGGARVSGEEREKERRSAFGCCLKTSSTPDRNRPR